MDCRDAKIEFEAVLNTLVDGVVIIDQLGTISLFNPACENMFGYSATEVVGQNVKILMPEPYHSEHDGYIDAYRKTSQKKIIGIGREVKAVRKDGTVFPIDLTVGETEVEGATIFVGIIRNLDIRYAKQLKYDRLQEEYSHLSRVSAMNEMAVVIAHELNQPLAASINFAETAKILVERGDTDAEKVSTILTDSIEQTQLASEIITRMRRFIERGEVEKSPNNVREMAESAARLVSMGTDFQGIEIKLDIDDDLPLVMVNNIQIQQVFVNLMKNACEAMQESDKRELHIAAVTSECGALVTLSIKDTGHGIEDANMSTLFKPFSTEKPGGMGLGLSISKSIIQYHGGELWVEKSAPACTIFKFSLPAAV